MHPAMSRETPLSQVETYSISIYQTLRDVSPEAPSIKTRVLLLLNLSGYSPDFNPIEMAFSKFKTLLRTAAVQTIAGLW
jgi:hypothetical protein